MLYHERVWIQLMLSLLTRNQKKMLALGVLVWLAISTVTGFTIAWPSRTHLAATGTKFLAQYVSPTPSPTVVPSPAVLAATQSAELYQVIKVVDGDTITVQRDGQKHTIRLIGIDTPESVHPTQAVECFGKEASAFLKTQLDQRFVSLVKDPSQQDLDKYQRWLRFVYRDDGLFLNELLVREGFAQEYTYQTPHQFQALFRQREQEAKSQQKGLWSPSACPE
jgi:micrococcal nuclease